jgi:hypothetical protein
LVRKVFASTGVEPSTKCELVILTTDGDSAIESTSPLPSTTLSSTRLCGPAVPEAILTSNSSAVFANGFYTHWMRANGSVAWTRENGSDAWYGLFGTRSRPFMVEFDFELPGRELLYLSESGTSTTPLVNNDINGSIDCGANFYVSRSLGVEVTFSRVLEDGTTALVGKGPCDNCEAALCAADRLCWVNQVYDSSPDDDAGNAQTSRKVLRCMTSDGTLSPVMDLPEDFEIAKEMKLQAAGGEQFLFTRETDAPSATDQGIAIGHFPVQQISENAVVSLSDFARPAAWAHAGRFVVHDVDMHIASRTETALYLSRYKR